MRYYCRMAVSSNLKNNTFNHVTQSLRITVSLQELKMFSVDLGKCEGKCLRIFSITLPIYL